MDNQLIVPEIELVAYFPKKSRFDFEQETYDCDTLFLLSRGSFDFSIGDGEISTIYSGNILFCPAGLALRRIAKEEMSLCMIKFEGCMSSERNVFRINDRIACDLKHISEQGIFIKPFLSSKKIHYGTDIVLELQNKSCESLVNQDMQRVLSFIDEDFTKKITNDDICERLCCSQVSMIARFKAAVGVTPQQYIIGKRLELAVELLLSGEATVAETAYRCGYDDPLYFSRLFTKYKGMSPTEYIKKSQL